MTDRHVMRESNVSRRYMIHGKGRIAGVSPAIVTVNGIPAARDVTVVHRRTQRVVARTVSAADGSYEFPYLDQSQKFTVYAWDRFGVHNGVIVDNVSPALMPEFEP